MAARRAAGAEGGRKIKRKRKEKEGERRERRSATGEVALRGEYGAD
jgi:hypothetical protein